MATPPAAAPRGPRGESCHRRSRPETPWLAGAAPSGLLGARHLVNLPSVGLSGKLQDFSVPEILQVLAFNQKTGRLTIARREGEGLLLFRRGRIIYSASSSLRDTLGNILLRMGVIDEATLTAALEVQHASPEERRLGSVLVEMGKVAPASIEEAMRYQTETVVRELIQWQTGFFRFEAMEIPEHGEVAVDARDILIAEGLNTEAILIEVTRRLDESLGAQDGQDDGPERSASPAAGELRTVSLRDLITEMRSPVLRAEACLSLLRFASQLLSRAVLLAVRGNEARAVGYFGVGGHAEGPQLPADELRCSLAELPLLADVVQRRETCRGRVPASSAHTALLQQGGAAQAQEVVAIPMVVGGGVAMILYGDNGPDGAPIGRVEDLELAMAEAALAMEREALEARTRHLDRARPDP